MARPKAAYIQQHFSVETAQTGRYSFQDKNGSSWSRRVNGGVGLTRIVSAITEDGDLIVEHNRAQYTDLRTRSNAQLNAWMGRTTTILNWRYGHREAKVISAFGSQKALEEKGERIVSLRGWKPVEWLPLYFGAARSLSEANLGRYSVKISTDFPSRQVDSAYIFGVGAGSHKDGLWSDYYNVIGAGVEAFRSLREQGGDLDPALQAGRLAIASSIKALRATV